MNIATLSLEWTSSFSSTKGRGWSIKICGRNITSDIDLSANKFVKAATAPYEKKTKSGTGPDGWIITPVQNPSMAFQNGGRLWEPPMGHVADYLQIMHEHGYRVVGTHSLFTIGHPILAWTLQKL